MPDTSPIEPAVELVGLSSGQYPMTMAGARLMAGMGLSLSTRLLDGFPFELVIVCKVSKTTGISNNCLHLLWNEKSFPKNIAYLLLISVLNIFKNRYRYFPILNLKAIICRYYLWTDNIEHP